MPQYLVIPKSASIEYNKQFSIVYEQIFNFKREVYLITGNVI